MDRTRKKTCLLLPALLCFLSLAAQKKEEPDRKLWLHYMDRIARPVLANLAAGTLKEKMPVVLPANVDNAASRTRASYLEAFGRTLSGIAPWLNGEGGSPEEQALREQYRAWAIKAVARAVDTSSKDYLAWSGGQPLVDASFFALGLVRCPWLWNHLADSTRAQVVVALRRTRGTVPVYSNWILFSSMIEAFFCKYGYEYDKVRIEFGIREFAQHWYVGDGMFSDGMNFAFDYYNSYVIQPYLVNILAALEDKGATYAWFAPQLEKITRRYAELQERMISADGSFPVTGRSITYRGGAFHHLADMSLRKKLPASLSPAQVRCALTAVLKKTMAASQTFTAEGWLNIGLSGRQPDLAERYINTGSVYLCMNLFLPLGLPETDEFWASPARPWTAIKAWSGEQLPADHALDLH
ncbi:DUF2264 domain-containing protein [Flaviaesturariibacter amylovorans]|uniref:DUF2264 domain-containing protein n=1 Tax=Flaviaesturariibacter amylovorans TaxID=1084520 RepID=A0ABP8H7T2_9BACT